jgi:hypothetical protein
MPAVQTPTPDAIREAARFLDGADVETVAARLEALEREADVLRAVVRILRKREADERRRQEFVAAQKAGKAKAVSHAAL